VKDISLAPIFTRVYEVIFSRGNLAERILAKLAGDFSPRKIINIYQHLADCLQHNEMFH
jgi:hypothetical protein